MAIDSQTEKIVALHHGIKRKRNMKQPTSPLRLLGTHHAGASSLMADVGIRKRMKSIPTLLTLGISLCFLAGCDTFNGNIRFVNQSAQEIYVGRVVGFAHEPPCGVLIPGATAGAGMNRMKFPHQVQIHWWYKGQNQKDATITTLDLSQIKAPQDYYSEDLRFTFNPDRSWSVDVKKD